MSTLEAKAQQTLADPTFDVEGFVKNINIHYQNKEIVRSLSTIPSILVNLVKSGEYRFLEIQPNLVDIKVFPKMEQEGYEVWHREKKNNSRQYDSHWYGVVIDDQTCIHYRCLGHWGTCNYTFEVIKGEGALKKSRQRWKRLKMYGKGDIPPEKQLPAVYLVRERLLEWANKNLLLKKPYRRYSKSEFRWRVKQDPSLNGYTPYNLWPRIAFSLLQSGKDHVRVQIKTEKSNVLNTADAKKSKSSWPRDAYLITKKFKINDPHLFVKIFDWVVKSDKLANEHYKLEIKNKLDNLRKKAGIV